MNQETNAGTQDAQQEKATQNKRSKSAGKNRPVLVTSSNDLAMTDQSVELMSDTTQQVEEVVPPTTVEVSRPRRFPKFFSSVGKNENDGTVEADQAAARIARATRNSGVSSASSRIAKDSQPAQSQSNTNKVSTNKPTPKAAPAKAAPSRGGFKTKYLFGVVIYIFAAMLVGQYERAFLVANHLDKALFQIGSFAVTTSTALYLLTLIILLVVLARFDLIPRSLGAMSNQPTTQRGKPGQSSGSEDAKSPQPTTKQGVKGADDDLYQEYREQQRYLQRRERKK
jgi:hypothetical protein